MQSKAATVDKYLAELPAERREVLEAVRAVILKNLPAGYEERNLLPKSGAGIEPPATRSPRPAC